MDVAAQVRQIVADVLDVPPEQVTPAFSPDDTPKWDSVQHLNLILALETTFDVQFAPEEAAEMMNVELITLLVREKLGA